MIPRNTRLIVPCLGRRWLSLSAILLGLAVTGCSSDQFGTVPVEGIVSYNGTVLTHGVVYFAPMGDPAAAGDGGPVIVGKSAGGVVNDQGHFSLSTYEPGDGAVAGRHRVCWQAEEEHVEGKRPPGAPREAFAEVDIPPSGIKDLKVDLHMP